MLVVAEIVGFHDVSIAELGVKVANVSSPVGVTSSVQASCPTDFEPVSLYRARLNQLKTERFALQNGHSVGDDN